MWNNAVHRSLTIVAVVAVAMTVAGCAPSAEPVSAPSSEAAAWDPAVHRLESTQQLAEMLGIEDPPEVEAIRLILPNEDSIWVSCLNDAGYDFTSAPGGGLNWPKDQRPEIMDAMNLAFFTCAESYPIDPKYSAPETEEHLKWMYRYESTTPLDCFAEKGYPYGGTPPSEQAYIDSGGAWSPYAVLPPSWAAYELLSEHCPQDPPEYYEQPFW